jgi:hypothetical protein
MRSRRSGGSDDRVRADADVDLPAGELPAAQFGEMVSERTRLVAVTAAGNVPGTRPDAAAITAIARAVRGGHHRDRPRRTQRRHRPPRLG